MIAFAENESNLLLENTTIVVEAPLAPPAKPRKPRVWTSFAALFLSIFVGQLLTIAAFASVGLGVGVVMGARGADSAAIQSTIQSIFAMPLPVLLLSLIPFQLGMTLVVFYAARRSKTPLKERLGLLPQSGRTFGPFRLISMAAFTISAALASLIGSIMLLGDVSSDNPISNVITDGSWLTITVLSIVLSVIPALVEETLFRGYIQRRFLQRWSPAVAIGATTVLFALMHMDSLQHIIAVLPLGMVVGLVAYRSNSVKPGMLIHGIHNVAAVGFAAACTALGPVLGEEGVGYMMLGTIVVLGVIGLPAVISLFRSVKALPEVEAPVAAAIETAPAAKTPSVLLRESRSNEILTGSRLTGSRLTESAV